jgi:hypothetical protein
MDPQEAMAAAATSPWTVLDLLTGTTSAAAAAVVAVDLHHHRHLQ